MGMAVKKKKTGDAPVAAAKPSRKKVDEPVAEHVNGKELRGIVRMAGRDLRGNLNLVRAIRSIRGIGQSMGKVLSQVAIQKLSLTPKTLVGELDEHQIEQLEKILSNPQDHGVAPFMFNRQKEYQTDSVKHLISTDLQYAVKQDIDHEKDSQTWKGYRHSYGQKVRGQRTRSTGRKGMTVGVLRKAAKAASAPAAGAPADKGKDAKK